MSEEAHKHPNYMLIFVALAVLTVVEIGAAKVGFAMDLWTTTVVVLVLLALVKAALVALYFMHLISERTAFILIVSFPLLLAVVLVVSLIPDVVFKG